jgi:hypothetical protein
MVEWDYKVFEGKIYARRDDRIDQLVPHMGA